MRGKKAYLHGVLWFVCMAMQLILDGTFDIEGWPGWAKGKRAGWLDVLSWVYVAFGDGQSAAEHWSPYPFLIRLSILLLGSSLPC